MNELHVQFEKPNVLFQFESAGGIDVREHRLEDELNAAAIEEKRKAAMAVLESIDQRLADHLQMVNQRRDELNSLVLAYVDTIAANCFTTDLDLVGHRIRDLLTAGINELDGGEPIRVWVHPDSLDAIQSLCHGDALENSDLRIATDPLLQRGDIRLESSDSGLIGRVQSQIAAAQFEFQTRNKTEACA